jgi:uncharacterized protein YuzE
MSALYRELSTTALLALIKRTPNGHLWSPYNTDADVVYVNLKKPAHVTESELTGEDVIVRYEGDEAVGYTILHASKR